MIDGQPNRRATEPAEAPLVKPRRRAVLRAGLGVSLSASLVGCAFDHDRDLDDANAPAYVPLSRPARVAWVFGSGGPRGFVHVGVLKALNELGLKPDLLVGASVGSLVATLAGAGLTATDIERLALELQPMTIASLAMGANENLSGAPLAAWIRDQIGARPLQGLAVPVACVALRLSDRAIVSFTSGDAGAAVQASSAIEKQFAPVRIRGQRYADPDAERPLPVREARRLGALRVLAVDASAHEDRAPEGAQRYREADLRKRALIRPDAAIADVLLHPDFGYWVSFSREFRMRAIEAGYRATLAQGFALRAMHAL